MCVPLLKCVYSMPVSPNATVFPTFNITVNTTEPIWQVSLSFFQRRNHLIFFFSSRFYCRQTGHCQKGMVLGINAPSSGPNTFENFLQLAEHTNSSSNAASISPSSGNTGSSSSSSGAGRTAVSAGLTMGVVGVLAFALL